MERSVSRTDMRWPHAVTFVTAAEGDRQQRWLVATSIEIVRKLASQRRVVLVDLASGAPPAIAAALGIEPAAGIVDVLFRGASFSTTAVRPPSESFHYLQLGEGPPPMSVLLQHPRWEKIAQRLPEAGAHLVLSVPAAVWLEAGPARGFETCIVLNASGADVELPTGARQLAEFLAPLAVREAADLDLEPRAEGVSAAEELEADDAEVGGAEEDGDAEVGVAKRWAAEATTDDEPAVEPSAAEASEGSESEAVVPPVEAIVPPRSEPQPAERPRVLLEPLGSARKAGRRRPARRGGLVPAAGVIAAALLAFAFWRVIANGGDAALTPPLEAAAETVAVAEPATRRPGPAETAVPQTKLPFSVAIASYSSFEDAEARRRKLTRPDLPFFVAPTPVRGVVWYRVFAGVLPERAQAEELMAQLVRDGIKDTIRGWDVRPARYAFSFGTYNTARDAGAVVETLFEQGVPAYIVPARRAGDELGFHVYAGGYESEEDARVLRERIERAGLDGKLVERVGLISQ